MYSPMIHSEVNHLEVPLASVRLELQIYSIHSALDLILSMFFLILGLMMIFSLDHKNNLSLYFRLAMLSN